MNTWYYELNGFITKVWADSYISDTGLSIFELWVWNSYLHFPISISSGWSTKVSVEMYCSQNVSKAIREILWVVLFGYNRCMSFESL